MSNNVASTVRVRGLSCQDQQPFTLSIFLITTCFFVCYLIQPFATSQQGTDYLHTLQIRKLKPREAWQLTKGQQPASERPKFTLGPIWTPGPMAEGQSRKPAEAQVLEPLIKARPKSSPSPGLPHPVHP